MEGTRGHHCHPWVPAGSDMGAPSAPQCPLAGQLLLHRPGPTPRILATDFGASPAVLAQGILLFASALNAVVPVQKTQDKIQTGGKRRLPRSPVTRVGAVNSSRGKSLFGAFLAEHKGRNPAYQDEGLAKSQRGNICFKGGDQSPPAWFSSLLPPMGPARAKCPTCCRWHSGQGTAGWSPAAACCQPVLGPPHLGRGDPAPLSSLGGPSPAAESRWEMFLKLTAASAASRHHQTPAHPACHARGWMNPNRVPRSSGSLCAQGDVVGNRAFREQLGYRVF